MPDRWAHPLDEAQRRRRRANAVVTPGFFEIDAVGWGLDLLRALGVTVAVAATGYLLACLIGVIAAAAALAGTAPLRLVAAAYVAVLRGVPDILVIYLFYFGSSSLAAFVGALLGSSGFVAAPAFLTGAAALAVVAGAYLCEVFRGAVQALSKGEIEAARAVGMPPLLLLRRIVLPQAARHAVPGMGNVWLLVLKESALVSVIGLVELMRQAQIGAGSTRRPFTFYIAAAALYLAVTGLSGFAFRRAEARAMRGIVREAAR
jgi:octopine/nopaline transport system permease protein